MGEDFGRYELLRRIGIGGMAEVFIAKTFGAEGFVKEVVIKRILPTFSSDPDFVRMFINEARLAALLQHPNIVQIFDFNQVQGVYYIAMEWVDGKDLKNIFDASRRRQLPIPLRAAVHIGVETLKGLHYAHTRSEHGQSLDLVHRDISPHNLLVSFSGGVKVADFGIAKVSAFASATRSGIVKGKLGYMSPEQAANQSLDARSDIFSLGIVLWELLAGRRLYQGDSELELLAKAKEAFVPPVSDFNPAVPDGLARLLNRMLKVDPKHRCASAADALSELSQFARVGDELEMAQFLAELLPAERGRERQAETLFMPAKQAMLVPFQTAPADAQTRALGDSGQTQPVDSAMIDAAQPIDSAMIDAAQPIDSAMIDAAQLVDSAMIDAAQPIDSAMIDAAQLVDSLHITAPFSSTYAKRTTPSRKWLVWPLIGLTLSLVGIGFWRGRAGVERQQKQAAPLPAAELKLASNDRPRELKIEGVEVGPTPLQIKGPTGQGINLQSASGEPPFQERLVLGEVKHWTTPPTAPRAPIAPPASAPASAPRTADAHRDHRRLYGYLDLIVIPWAQVKIDGRALGQTPLRNQRLTEGLHTLELENGEMNRRETIHLKIRADQTANVRREWGQ